MLKRFKRDPRNLVGPDVGRAPLRTIDLSGTKVTFRCPPQTEAIPLFIGPDQFNIEQDTEASIYNPDNAYVTVFSSGWALADRSIWGAAYGGLAVTVAAGRTHFQNTHQSLVQLESFKKWLCNDLEACYGRWNREKWKNRGRYVNPVTPERSFWRYPKSEGELRIETFNGVDWCKYEIFQLGQPPCYHFDAAIGRNHTLSFSFCPSAYGGLDYFSPEHNVKQASEALIREIMATVTIQLSPEAQRQKDEVS